MLSFKVIVFVVFLIKSSIVSEGWELQNDRDPKILRNDVASPPKIFQENIGISYTDLDKSLVKALKNLPHRPIGVLVDDTVLSHESARKCIDMLLDNPEIKNEFLLMKYNSSGATLVLASTSTDKRIFKKLLNYNQNNNGYLDLNAQNGVVLFFSILKATDTLPSDSGILVFTHRKILDEDLSQLALRSLQMKRTKLYVVWQNAPSTEEALLKEVVSHSGGNFFTIPSGSKSEISSYSVDPSEPASLVLYQTYLSGKKTFTFPIDSDVSVIHFSITKGAKLAKFSSADRYEIDLLSESSVANFSEGSFLEEVDNVYEVHLNTQRATTAPIAGLWRLDVGKASAHDYNVTVSVQNNLKISSNTGANYKLPNRTGNHYKIIRLGVSGELQRIEEVVLEDFQGKTLVQPASFTINKMNQDEEVETLTDKEITLVLKNVPFEPFLIKVNGTDGKGNQFVRLSYYNYDIKNNRLPPISIDVSAGSELLVRPNQASNIYFEVVNNHDQVLYVQFSCKDEKHLLAWMQPRAAWLNPKQHLTVTVNTYAQPFAGIGYKDLITFSANGPFKAEKSTILSVESQHKIDKETPHMWHRYTSDCTNYLIGKCEYGTWNIEVTAQDKESGLLQISAGNTVLSFPNPYISGTKEEVVGYYSGSCCDPTLQLTAIDLSNNRRQYVADAYRTKLSTGIISAIVLGVILLIVIIIIVIIVIIKCRRKESGSMDLPNYRGPTSRY